MANTIAHLTQLIEILERMSLYRLALLSFLTIVLRTLDTISGKTPEKETASHSSQMGEPSQPNSTRSMP